MKDQQGNDRGGCEEDCLCVEYVKPKSADSKCDYCGHLPTKHKLLNPPKQPNKPEVPVVKPKEEEEEEEEEEEFVSKEDGTIYTPSSIPKKSSTVTTPAVAPSSKLVKKKSFLDELKNPAQFIKDKRKKKKA